MYRYIVDIGMLYSDSKPIEALLPITLLVKSYGTLANF